MKAWFNPEANVEKIFDIVDGVSGATVQWDPEKGIPIQVEHADPSVQALMDFRDNIYTIPFLNQMQ